MVGQLERSPARICGILAMAIANQLYPAGAADLTPLADATVSAREPSVCFGDRGELEIRSPRDFQPGAKCYLLFQIPPEARGRIASASLTLTRVRCAPWLYDVYVFGLPKDAERWDEQSITWRNCPANRGDTNYWSQNAVGPLARQRLNGYKYGVAEGDVVCLGRPWYVTRGGNLDLGRFLNENADEDGRVTLLLTTGMTGKYVNTFASREHEERPPPVLRLYLAEAEPEALSPEEQSLQHYRAMASDRWHKWRRDRERFPIAGWDFMRPGQQGWPEDPYGQYADAGFSMVRVNEQTYPLAVAAGLEAMFGWWQQLHRSAERVAYFMRQPSPTDRSVIGYFLDDEPDEPKCAECWARSREIYDRDQRAAIPMLNAGGLAGFETGCPAFLLKTCYTPLTSGETRPFFYPNLEELRRAANVLDIGLMGWALVSAHSSGSTHFRDASESDLYWQAYSIVAYGGQGLWYYRYDRGRPWFAPNGEPTEFFAMARSLNSQLHRLWPVLRHLQSTGVYHTLDVDGGVKGAWSTPFGWPVSIYRDGVIPPIAGFRGDEWLLGAFRNMDDEKDNDVYVLLQNKRHGMGKRSRELQATARLALADPYSQAQVYSPDTGRPQPTPSPVELTLGGGQARLLRFSERP